MLDIAQVRGRKFRYLIEHKVSVVHVGYLLMSRMVLSVEILFHGVPKLQYRQHNQFNPDD